MRPALDAEGVGTRRETYQVGQNTKRTFQPKSRYRKNTHGFRVRMRTREGRLVLKRRRLKGREHVSS